jgi:DNA-binding transcriptional LysR family regulator
LYDRLETELGGPLLTRAERGHPMTLTDLGTRVLHHAKGRADDTRCFPSSGSLELQRPS